MSNDNQLHQDEAALDRELPPIPGTPGAAPAPGTGPAVADAAPAPGDAMGAWGDAALMTVDLLVKGILCPAWTVDDPPRQNLIEAIAGVLNDLMPGGVGNLGNWGPYGKLAFAVGGIVVANFDMQRMQLKPMALPPKKPAPGDTASPAAGIDPDIVVKGTEAGPARPAPKKTPKKNKKKK